MIALPLLVLAPNDSDFDEAVILVDGREEETITLECTGARELAASLVRLVNAYREAYPPDESQKPYEAGPGTVAAGELP
jgi:hypothetical protein